MKRYEVKESCPIFNSIRVVEVADTYEEAKAFADKWKEAHNDREYYILDNWRDGSGCVVVPKEKRRD